MDVSWVAMRPANLIARSAPGTISRATLAWLVVSNSPDAASIGGNDVPPLQTCRLLPVKSAVDADGATEGAALLGATLGATLGAAELAAAVGATLGAALDAAAVGGEVGAAVTGGDVG